MEVIIGKNEVEFGYIEGDLSLPACLAYTLI